MEHLDTILLLMALLVGLYSVADRIGVSYPILLVIAGLGISLIPELPTIELSSEVALLLFLPPLLFDAARNTSWHDFKRNRDSIGRLAIGLVLFTTAGVAVVAHYFIPGFTWPLAFVLGAIVSPPDVVAATSALKGLHLPKRLVAILEGESLVNDASALIAYRFAVSAVVTGGFVFWDAAVEFVLVAFAGVAIGVFIGYVFTQLQKKFLNNPTVETVTTVLLPFVAYLFAEYLHVSGVLSVVAAGLYVSWRAHEIFSYQTRMQMNNFWETMIFLLNGFVFILIGLQLPDIMEDLGHRPVLEMVGYGLLISCVVIAIRIMWVFPTVHFANWFSRKSGGISGGAALTNNRHLFLISWAGMRGVVSLATALALPVTLANGDDFPQRNVILFITFVVILVTLVFQGLTIPFLVRWLGIEEPEEKTITEERRLRLAMANSTITLIDESLAHHTPKAVLDEVRGRLQRQVSYFNGVLQTKTHCKTLEAQRDQFRHYLQSERAVIDHQRAFLVQMHKKGVFSADVLRRIEQDLDTRSMDLQSKIKAFGSE